MNNPGASSPGRFQVTAPTTTWQPLEVSRPQILRPRTRVDAHSFDGTEQIELYLSPGEMPLDPTALPVGIPAIGREGFMHTPGLWWYFINCVSSGFFVMDFERVDAFGEAEATAEIFRPRSYRAVNLPHVNMVPGDEQILFAADEYIERKAVVVQNIARDAGGAGDGYVWLNWGGFIAPLFSRANVILKPGERHVFDATQLPLYSLRCAVNPASADPATVSCTVYS